MTYTLDIDPADGKKVVSNPTDADIRKTVASLRDDAEPGFLILRKDAGNMIQVTCVAKDSFAIQTQEGDEKHQYQASKNVSAEAAIKLLLAYRTGNPDWKKLAEPKLIQVSESQGLTIIGVLSAEEAKLIKEMA